MTTLQPELLSEVFSLTVDPDDVDERLSQANTLSLVCRTWRDVAHSTPVLWASLSLETRFSFRPFYFQPAVYHIYPKVELVEKWMERSRAYPLDLTIRTLQSLKDAEDEQVRIVQLVQKNHFRIRSLHISCTGYTALSLELGFKVLDALGEGDVTIPKLEVLKVNVLNPQALDPFTLKIPYSSRLSELCFDFGSEIPITIDTVFPLKPLQNLRSFTLKTSHVALPLLDTDRVLDMLEASSDTLRSFSWDTTTDLSPPSHRGHHKINSRSITLPSLTTLFVRTHSSPTLFLSLLTLPALTSLSLHLDLDVYLNINLPLAFHPDGLLARSICPTTGKTKLEEIQVQTSNAIPLHEVLEVLRISPALKTFMFTVPLTEELALSLVSESESESDPSSPDSAATGTLAPHLHHMDFSLCWKGNFSLLVEAFAKMVLSRWGGPSGLYPGKGALKSVTVDHVQKTERETMYAHPGLKGCIEEGFGLELDPF